MTEDSTEIAFYNEGFDITIKKGELHRASYIVDSLKNFDKRDYHVTKEMFDNWDK